MFIESSSTAVAGARAGARPRYRKLRNLAAVLIAAIVAGLGLASWVDSIGWKFFHTGESLTLTLGDLAKRLAAKDVPALGKFYASDFHGAPLGLTGLKM